MKFSDKEEQQLKRWSCIELDAIGQQNPDVLAKIIVSSVKEDKNVNALKAHCISQLKTFLKTYTEDFVEVLFQAIEDGTYQIDLEESDTGDNDEDDDNRDRDSIRRRESTSPTGSDEEDRSHRNRYRRDSSDNIDQPAIGSVPSSSSAVTAAPKGNYSRAQQDSRDQNQSQSRGHNNQVSNQYPRPAPSAHIPQQSQYGRGPGGAGGGRGNPQGGRFLPSTHANKHYRAEAAGHGPTGSGSYGNYSSHGSYPGVASQVNDSASYNPYASSMYPGLAAAGYVMGFPPQPTTQLLTNAPISSYGWASGMSTGMGGSYPGPSGVVGTSADMTYGGDFGGEYRSGSSQGVMSSPIRTAENTYIPTGLTGSGPPPPPAEPMEGNSGSGGNGGSHRPPPPTGPAPPRTTALEVMTNLNASAVYGYGASINLPAGAVSSATAESDGGTSIGGYGFGADSSYGAVIHPHMTHNSGDMQGFGGYRQQQPQRGGGGFQQKVYYPPLPEHERCTLKVTGIPSYVTEEQLRGHFEDFGYIVEMQLTQAPPSKRVAEEGGDPDKKRIYFECLVQYFSAANCKKCLNSPRSVLDNRYIQVRPSFFNIIPPVDVVFPGEAVVERDAAIVAGTYVNPNKTTASAGSRKRPLNASAAAFVPGASNKYRRGADDAKILYQPTTPGLAEGSADDGHSQQINNNNNNNNNNNTNEGVAIESGEQPVQHASGQISSPPPALTQEKLEMKQSLSKLKELRQQADEIAKKKEAILLAQVEKCRGMVDKLEQSADSDSKSTMLQNLEAKILALQTQLRTLRDQAAERIAADAAAASGQPAPGSSASAGAFYHPGGAGNGFGGRGRGSRGGRFPPAGGRGYRGGGGGYAPSAGRGRFGGRGRGRGSYYGQQQPQNYTAASGGASFGGEEEGGGQAYEDHGAGDWQASEAGDFSNLEET